MKTPAGFGIAADLLPAFHLPGQLQIVLDVVLEVVRVHKVLAGVVGRIDIDQLDLAGIALLQQLEHFEVVALDHQVLGGVPIHALVRAGAQRAGARCQGQLPGAALAVPVEAVFLISIGDGMVTHQRLEHIHVYRRSVRTFSNEFREQGLELLYIARHQVGGLGLGAGCRDLFHDALRHSSIFKVVGARWPARPARA